MREYSRRYPAIVPRREFYPSWVQTMFAIGHLHLPGSSFKVSYSVWDPTFGTVSSHRRFDQLDAETRSRFEARIKGVIPLPPPWFFELVQQDVFTASTNTASALLHLANESEVSVYVPSAMNRTVVRDPQGATSPTSVTPTVERDSIFISYSHRDAKYLTQLKEMLRPVERAGNLLLWDDTKLVAGEKWRDEIRDAIGRARVAVLLVSRAFLASEFIANHELPPLLKAAEADGLRVFWIAVSPCLYQMTPVADYQAASDPDKPLIRQTGYQREETLRRICVALLDCLRDGGRSV